MKLRTVTVIWRAILMLGVVAWCEAQEPHHVEDWPDGISTITLPVIRPGTPYWHDEQPKPLTLDSLVVLWDEYKSWCDSDSGWIKFQSLAKCRELGYTVEDCGWHIKIYRKADIEGFMDFIRRKAGE
jgi:hypothetical protein